MCFSAKEEVGQTAQDQARGVFEGSHSVKTPLASPKPQNECPFGSLFKEFWFRQKKGGRGRRGSLVQIGIICPNNSYQHNLSPYSRVLFQKRFFPSYRAKNMEKKTHSLFQETIWEFLFSAWKNFPKSLLKWKSTPPILEISSFSILVNQALEQEIGLLCKELKFAVLNELSQSILC